MHFKLPQSVILALAVTVLSMTACNENSDSNNPDDMEVKDPKKDLKGNPDLVTDSVELSQLAGFETGEFSYSVEDFFKNPDKSQFQISPDGQYFSYMAPWEDRMNVFVQEIGSDETLRITSETERDIPGYGWANSNRILFVKDDGGDENFKLFAVDKDGANPTDLTPFDSVTIQIIDDLPEKDEEMIIGMNKENKMLHEPYRININTGELTKLAENTNIMEPIQGWMTDHDGKLRVAMKITDGTNANLLYRETEDQDFRIVLTTDFREGVNPRFFDFDNGDVVYATSNLDRDKDAVVKFNMATGEELEVLYEHPEVDVSGISYSRKRKVPTYISYRVDKRELNFLDGEYEKIYNRIKSELPSYEVVITSYNDDENKFLVRTYSDRSRGGYYFYDVTTDNMTHLADLSPWINESEMATMQPVTFTARDGLVLRGYLTLPPNSEGKNLPAVINPHGGPWARDNWGFNPEVQLMANRGYAVLQINFRGSTGFGRAFWEASFKQWGQTMQDDITDGTQWLIDQGIADADRIAIYGASYGGYATLAGIVKEPDMYACAVDYVGVSNLLTFLETIPPYWKPFLEMMYTMVGDPETDLEMMEANSPALHADKITTPLFVVQGANDPRVNIDESDQIVEALRNNGIDVPYMVKYNEGHGFSNEENRFEFYHAMIGFLAKHLKKEGTDS